MIILSDKVQIIGDPTTPEDDYIIDKPTQKITVTKKIISPTTSNINQKKSKQHQKSKIEKTKSYEMER